MRDVSFCLCEFLDIGVVEVNHVYENRLWAEETDGFAVGHWRVAATLEEFAVGFYLGAVHGYWDVFLAGEGCHFFIQIIGDTI